MCSRKSQCSQSDNNNKEINNERVKVANAWILRRKLSQYKPFERPCEPSGLPAGDKSNRCPLGLDLLLPSPGNHHRGKNSSTCQEKREELCSLPSREQGLVTRSFRWPSPRGAHASVSEKPSGGPRGEGSRELQRDKTIS